VLVDFLLGGLGLERESAREREGGVMGRMGGNMPC
jgi:hypothetical protein